MKYLSLFLLLFMTLLAACGPAAAPEPPGSLPEISQTEPNSPLPPPAALESLPNSPIVTPRADGDSRGLDAMVDPTWDEDPNNLILTATFCCGFTTPLVPLNYIADASIWGDGRIVWVEYNSDGGRQVLQGTLTRDQLQALLQQAIDAGFFGWQDRYADQTIADAADKCLSINLESQTKQVCEYFRGAPEGFHTLYEVVAGGAGATGTKFTPENGYLKATVLEIAADATVPVSAAWPADQLGLSLGEVTEGRWVDGDVLATAWNIVNASWQGMIVQDGDTYYEMSVQVPGLSFSEPPVSK